MVRMKPWVGTKPQVGMKPWIGEDGTSDRDKTLGCGDRTTCCNKEVEVECPHDGGWCHARCRRGSGCGKVQSDTWAELAYDGVEGSTYVVGTRTATVSRMLART